MTTTPLPPLPKEFCCTNSLWAYYTADQMHAYATQARADLEAENQRLREALGDCLTWMEQLRACGDAGNWHWGEDSEYTRGVAALEKQP